VARLGTTKGAAHAGDVILLRLFLVGGAGLAAVLISALLLLGFGNRITRELTGFRTAVRALADERLPALVSRLRQGEDVDVAVEAPPLALRTRTREVTETAEAFSAVQRTAIEAAVGQAQLRKGVSNVFRSLARRNQSLLQRQLKMLDGMERATHDPEALAQSFRLDHLTTRMRRQAEGLIILSGSAPGRGWRQPVPVVEVLRGATGEIEDYVRVDLVTDSRDFIPGTAVADVTHLLAELIENAVLYSPPHTRVQVKASRVANGYVVEIEDRGLGIPAETLDVLNERLARPPEFDLADSDQLGLFVAGRLAARHEIKVSLRGSPYGGTSAIVLMPHRLVVADADSAPAIGQHATEPGPGREPAGEPPVTGPRLALGAEAASQEPGSVQTWLPAGPRRQARSRPTMRPVPAWPARAGPRTCPVGCARPAWPRSSATPRRPHPAVAGTRCARPSRRGP
jgi:signal transduction histidine kinase